MPSKKIVGNATGKNNVSLFSKEWLTWLEDKDITREKPMYVDAAKYGKFDRHKNKVPTDEDEQKDYYKDKHVFTVDGYNEKTNTAYEANGCYWHGCRKCFPENTFKYNQTQERKTF